MIPPSFYSRAPSSLTSTLAGLFPIHNAAFHFQRRFPPKSSVRANKTNSVHRVVLVFASPSFPPSSAPNLVVRVVEHMWPYSDQPAFPACGDDSASPHTPPEPSHLTLSYVFFFFAGFSPFLPTAVSICCTLSLCLSPSLAWCLFFTLSDTHMQNDARRGSWSLCSSSLSAAYELASRAERDTQTESEEWESRWPRNLPPRPGAAAAAAARSQPLCVTADPPSSTSD